ncbi:MoaA/NifB/PqqE/SkfB family radical SAM enzyme [Bradyrhizobium embrapense]
MRSKEMIRSIYRASVPLGMRKAIRRISAIERLMDGPPPIVERIVLPTAAGLLKDERFGITSERHALMASHTPLISLNMGQYCSHGCVYCVSHMGDRKKRSGYLEEIGWEEYGRQLLRLAGDAKVTYNFAGPGECAEHEHFPELAHLLLNAGHWIWIQTHGLSSKSIARALNSFPKELVSRKVNFHLSFHIAAYLDDKDDRRLRAYLDKHVATIASFGCTTCIIVPMSPKVLAWSRFEESMDLIASICKQRGARFIPSLVEFHGPYEGRHYPADYTNEEQQRLSELMAKYGNPSRGTMAGDQAVIVGDSLMLRGMPCYAKALITEVNGDGSLRHCQSDPEDNFGHLRDAEGLTKNPEAHPCPFDRCLCVSVGYNMSLAPNGISLKDYADEMKRVTA